MNLLQLLLHFLSGRTTVSRIGGEGIRDVFNLIGFLIPTLSKTTKKVFVLKYTFNYFFLKTCSFVKAGALKHLQYYLLKCVIVCIDASIAFSMLFAFLLHCVCHLHIDCDLAFFMIADSV